MNLNTQNEFERKVREQMNTFEPQVPSHIWENISAELDKRSSTSIEDATPKMVSLDISKRKSSAPRIWWIAASSLLIIGSAWFMLGQDEFETEGGPSQNLSVASMSTDATSQRINEIEQMETDSKTPVLAQTVQQHLQTTESKRQAEPKKITVIQERSSEVAEKAQVRIGLASNEEKQIQTPADQSILGGNAETSLAAVSEEDVTEAAKPLDLTEKPDVLLADASNVGPSQSLPEESSLYKPASGVARLLNLMISKIDKRPEKQLAFTSDDEGNLRISFQPTRVKPEHR